MSQRYSPENPWVPPREREPPAMDHEPGWKESAFTEEMGRLILERIAAGETVKAITADPRMPCYATVYRWREVIPEFGEAWRELRAQMAADAVWVDAEKAKARAWMRAHRRRLDGKPPRDWKSGRRSTYTPQIAEALCEAVMFGASLSEAVKTPGMPSAKAVYRWLRNEPAFRAAYAKACWLRDDVIADQIHDLCNRFGMAARPVAEAMNGRRGRIAPRKYATGL
ncbi:terminase small subunit-like protein [Phenylobacterium soli]|uniref:Uncharacterized protein n=1 Tax=Phenylobacterium soli TaxID=2170551 RepID=A0A328AHI7_9CAUL|nr:hypothetical protein [Phenylobacterium soli]RAK54373.1 hypothetical protein DJ017_07480 [Phenylobacterium soli]